MKTIYIYTHLGLGDIITANGLVHTIAEEYDRVYVFCKPLNIKNVAYMYRHNPKIKLIALDDIGAKHFMWFNPDNKYLIVGHDEFNKIWNNPGNTLKIDEIFYKMADVPIENKWNKFGFERDPEREKACFDSLKIDGPFNFVHDKDDRKIKPNNGLRNIRPSMDWMLWDYLSVIEKSWELHCINSSFYCMIDSMKLKIRRPCLHQHKEWGEDMLGVLGIPWNVLK